MARSPISTMHVHDRAEIAHDARRVDALTDSTAPALEPFARAALLRITAETIAEDFAAPASAALTPLVDARDLDALGRSTRRAHASLADAVRDALPPLGDDAIVERARSLAQLAVTAWSATLHEALAETRHISLVDGVYVDDTARAHLDALARAQGIDDPASMFRAVRDAIFADRDVVAFPGGLHLEVVARGNDGTMHVAAMREDEAGGAASEEVVRSGERVRDRDPHAAPAESPRDVKKVR